MEALFTGLEAAFRYFGGVPRELLFDQMRSVVIDDERDTDGPLILNAKFVRFAEHWGFRPRACRPYRAQTKPRRRGHGRRLDRPAHAPLPRRQQWSRMRLYPAMSRLVAPA